MNERYLDEVTTIPAQDAEVRTIVQAGALRDLPEHLHEAGLTARAFVLTDSNVADLYEGQVRDTLDDAQIDHDVLVMPAGEENKTLEQFATFVSELSERNITRKDAVIAVGGGVVGDLGAFVASAINRGNPLVHVPTTLLAMVDSSIGGKTGIDFGGKNKTGSFYQPKLVVADTETLQTLDQRVYTEGFGEVAKYAMLDADFWNELAKSEQLDQTQFATISDLVARCMKYKLDVVAADPHEQNPHGGRVFLNYGHTLGHGLEAAGGYTELLHGEGVSIGMNFAAQLAVKLEVAKPELVEAQAELIESIGLPLTYKGDASVDEIMRHIAKDKKNDGAGSTRFVLPEGIGKMRVQQVDNNVVRDAVEAFLDDREL